MQVIESGVNGWLYLLQHRDVDDRERCVWMTLLTAASRCRWSRAVCMDDSTYCSIEMQVIESGVYGWLYLLRHRDAGDRERCVWMTLLTAASRCRWSRAVCMDDYLLQHRDAGDRQRCEWMTLLTAASRCRWSRAVCMDDYLLQHRDTGDRQRCEWMTLLTAASRCRWSRAVCMDDSTYCGIEMQVIESGVYGWLYLLRHRDAGDRERCVWMTLLTAASRCRWSRAVCMDDYLLQHRDAGDRQRCEWMTLLTAASRCRWSRAVCMDDYLLQHRDAGDRQRCEWMTLLTAASRCRWSRAVWMDDSTYCSIEMQVIESGVYGWLYLLQHRDAGDRERCVWMTLLTAASRCRWSRAVCMYDSTYCGIEMQVIESGVYGWLYLLQHRDVADRERCEWMTLLTAASRCRWSTAVWMDDSTYCSIEMQVIESGVNGWLYLLQHRDVGDRERCEWMTLLTAASRCRWSRAVCMDDYLLQHRDVTDRERCVWMTLLTAASRCRWSRAVWMDDSTYCSIEMQVIESGVNGWLYLLQHRDVDDRERCVWMTLLTAASRCRWSRAVCMDDSTYCSIEMQVIESGVNGWLYLLQHRDVGDRERCEWMTLLTAASRCRWSRAVCMDDYLLQHRDVTDRERCVWMTLLTAASRCRWSTAVWMDDSTYCSIEMQVIESGVNGWLYLLQHRDVDDRERCVWMTLLTAASRCRWSRAVCMDDSTYCSIEMQVIESGVYGWLYLLRHRDAGDRERCVWMTLLTAASRCRWSRAVCMDDYLLQHRDAGDRERCVWMTLLTAASRCRWSRAVCMDDSTYCSIKMQVIDSGVYGWLYLLRHRDAGDRERCVWMTLLTAASRCRWSTAVCMDDSTYCGIEMQMIESGVYGWLLTAASRCRWSRAVCMDDSTYCSIEMQVIESGVYGWLYLLQHRDAGDRERCVWTTLLTAASRCWWSRAVCMDDSTYCSIEMQVIESGVYGRLYLLQHRDAGDRERCVWMTLLTAASRCRWSRAVCMDDSTYCSIEMLVIESGVYGWLYLLQHRDAGDRERCVWTTLLTATSRCRWSRAVCMDDSGPRSTVVVRARSPGTSSFPSSLSSISSSPLFSSDFCVCSFSLPLEASMRSTCWAFCRHVNMKIETNKVKKKERKEMFYLTTHSTHFIYGYMASGVKKNAI